MKLRFVQTCEAYPEQYDVFAEDGERVGYVRLRGALTVEFLSCGCGCVLQADIDAGEFTDEERAFWLPAIETLLVRLMKKYNKEARDKIRGRSIYDGACQ